jgi:hypothetical protein
MTTLTIKQTYCAFCDWVAKTLKVSWNGFANTIQLMAYSRAAAELCRMGRYEEARVLMIEKTKLLNSKEER